MIGDLLFQPIGKDVSCVIGEIFGLWVLFVYREISVRKMTDWDKISEVGAIGDNVITSFVTNNKFDTKDRLAVEQPVTLSIEN